MHENLTTPKPKNHAICLTRFDMLAIGIQNGLGESVSVTYGNALADRLARTQQTADLPDADLIAIGSDVGLDEALSLTFGRALLERLALAQEAASAQACLTALRKEIRRVASMYDEVGKTEGYFVAAELRALADRSNRGGDNASQPPRHAEPDADLKERCAEIIYWHRTGRLQGEALQRYAQHHFGDTDHALQQAEARTAQEAYKLVIAS